MLAPGGRLVIVVPNRRGVWARFEHTPFGTGRPFSRGQLTELLRETNFTPSAWSEALCFPPSKRRWMMRFHQLLERSGRRLWPIFSGVVIVEAQKRLYQGIPVAQRASRRVFVPVLSPQGATRTARDIGQPSECIGRRQFAAIVAELSLANASILAGAGSLVKPPSRSLPLCCAWRRLRPRTPMRERHRSPFPSTSSWCWPSTFRARWTPTRQRCSGPVMSMRSGIPISSGRSNWAPTDASRSAISNGPAMCARNRSVPWQVVDSPESAAAFADRIAKRTYGGFRGTSISSAITFGTAMIEGADYREARRVIDVSGDGPNNIGAPVQAARDIAVSAGITINGLPILIRPSPTFTHLDDYYAECVTGGPGSFVLPVYASSEFATAIRRKLILEVSGDMPPPGVVLAAATGAIDCLKGERDRRLYSDPYFPELDK